jgi:hypothetical protein
MIHFVSYAAGDKYKALQQKQVEIIKTKGISSHFLYTEEWMKDQPFYHKHEDIFKVPEGAGCWLWKPYILLDALDRVSYGDIILYMDVGDVPRGCLVDKINRLIKGTGYVICGGKGHNKNYVRGDVFYKLGDKNKSFARVKSIEASFMAWVRNTDNIDIIRKWLDCCTDKEMILNVENKYLPNDYKFRRHSYDQGILSVLACIWGLTVTPYKFLRPDILFNKLG